MGKPLLQGCNLGIGKKQNGLLLKLTKLLKNGGIL